jgi:hypothetical protein
MKGVIALVGKVSAKDALIEQMGISEALDWLVGGCGLRNQSAASTSFICWRREEEMAAVRFQR